MSKLFAVAIVSEEQHPQHEDQVLQRQVVFWVVADDTDAAISQAEVRHKRYLPKGKIVNVAPALAPDWVTIVP